MTPEEYRALPPLDDPGVMSLQMVEALDLPKDWADLARQRAIAEFGRYMTSPRMAAIVMLTGFSNLEHIKVAQNKCREWMEDTNIPMEQRQAAAECIGLNAKAGKEMGEHLVKMAKEANIKSESEKPMNKPPSLALQMNFAPGTTPPSMTITEGAAPPDPAANADNEDLQAQLAEDLKR